MQQSGHSSEQPLARELDEDACQRIVEATFLAGCELAQQTDSTNDDCLLAIRTGRVVDHPWLFAANRQQAGRGRSGNRWWSGPGALTFTFSLVPEELDRQSTLSLLLAVPRTMV